MILDCFPKILKMGKLSHIMRTLVSVTSQITIGDVTNTTSGHNLPDKSCVADTAMQIELA